MSFFKNLFRKHDPPSNPALERAMHEVARNDNAKTRESLYKTILASTFIVQGNVSGGTEVRSGQRIADGNTHVAFKTVEHPPGRIVLPAFTDVQAFCSWTGGEAQWIALRAQELFQAIAPGTIDEVRVNPFRPEQKVSRPGGIITRTEFVALAQGLLPERSDSNVAQLKVAAGQRLLIGAPAEELPAEALKAIADYLEKIPALRGVYFFQMSNQSVTTGAIGLHFDAEPDAQQMQQMMSGVGRVMQGALPAGRSIDFIPLKPGKILDTVQKCGKALLKR